MHMNEEQKKELEELKRKIRESLNRIAQFEKELREEPEELLPSGASSPISYYISALNNQIYKDCPRSYTVDTFNCYATREEAEMEAKYLLAIRILRRCAEVENAKVPRNPDGVWVVTRISPICPVPLYVSPRAVTITDIPFNSLEGAERAIRELKKRGLWGVLVDGKE